MNSKKEVLERWFNRVWIKEDSTAIDEMFKPRTKDDGAYGLQNEDGLSPEEFKSFHKALLGLVKFEDFCIDNHAEKGNQILAECSFTLSDRSEKSKAPFIFKGCVAGNIVDGEIITADNYFNFLNLFETLGLLPENTFAQCLSGSKVM